MAGMLVRPAAGGPWLQVLPILAMCLLFGGCKSASARRLDPVYSAEKYKAELKFKFQPNITDPGLLRKIEPGDIIAFSSGDPSSASSVVLGNALTQVSHVAIVIPLHKKLRALSADSDQGTYIDTLERCIRGRVFYVYSFPPGLLQFDRLSDFAERAVFLARLDYDWSAIFFGADVTPNDFQEMVDEFTCATVVAAALHFSGLSLDRAWRGIVTPGDIIHSIARRNLNGPAVMGRKRAARGIDRETETWETLR